MIDTTGLPDPEEVVLADGLRARYRLAGPADGSGEVVLMLHGVGCSLDDFAEQQVLLGGRYRTLALDQAGFGGSQRLPEPTTLPGLAAHAGRFLDAVGAVGPVHVVGNSLGGAVAMQLAVASAAAGAPRAATLALADPAGFGREVTWALRVLAIRPLAARLLVPTAARSRRALRGIFHDPGLVTPERVALALERDSGPSAREAFTEVMSSIGTVRGARRDWREQLVPAVAALRLPTLVAWGRDDRVLPASQLQAARRLVPHAVTHEFPDTGHMPQIERAEEFAALVARFWEQARTPSP